MTRQMQSSMINDPGLHIELGKNPEIYAVWHVIGARSG